MKTLVFVCMFAIVASMSASAQIVAYASYSPVITTQPVSVIVSQGQEFMLSLSATGADEYQWKKNGVAIKGATSATYTVAKADASHGGNYYCEVMSGACTTATVTVKPNPANKK